MQQLWEAEIYTIILSMFTYILAELAGVKVHVADMVSQQAVDLGGAQVNRAGTETISFHSASFQWTIGWQPLKRTQVVVKGGHGPSDLPSITVDHLSCQVLRVAVSARREVINDDGQKKQTPPLSKSNSKVCWTRDALITIHGWQPLQLGRAVFLMLLVTAQQSGRAAWLTFNCTIESTQLQCTCLMVSVKCSETFSLVPTCQQLVWNGPHIIADSHAPHVPTELWFKRMVFVSAALDVTGHKSLLANTNHFFKYLQYTLN